MGSYDITFCSNLNCKNIDCKRNQNRETVSGISGFDYISIGNFPECEYWEEANDNNI